MDRTPPNTSPPVKGEKIVNKDDYKTADKDELLSKIKDRYEDGVGEFEENRRMHSEDLNFVYNAEAQGQWDPVVLEARRGKPSYTFNRVIGPVNLVVADMRQTRPSAKFRPSSDGASQAVADVFGGLWRSIERNSRATTIYKNQYKFAVAGGYGAFRLMPEYACEDSFDQVLTIKDIPNPQTVVWDAECADACAGDAMWAIVGERISKEKHRALFPNSEEPSAVSFSMGRDSMGWFTDKEVRVVEYMEKVPFEKVIAQMSNGTVVDYTAKLKAVDDDLEASKLGPDKAIRIVKTRKILKWRVMWVKCDGGQILEGPEYYDWKRIPIVRVPGRYINIEGKKKFQSLVRHSKDAQRSYNSRCSDMIERSALTPKAPYLATETMIKGYENEWAQANTASRPYLPYNVDKNAIDAGGMPIRTPPIDMPQAALALAQQAASDIQATTGFFDPALGNAEDMNRVSGKALVQHTRRSDLGSFEFIDGFGDALQLAAEMALDMIPTIYDTARVETIIGQDGIEKMAHLNTEGPDGDIINDLSKGRYSCTVSIGPDYQTARQETLQTLIDAAATIPMIAQLAPDLLAKNIDSPDSDELTRRLRIPLIHQGIIQPTPEEQQSLPPPPPPDPLKVAELKREQALADRDQSSAIIAKAKAGNVDLDEYKKMLVTAGQHLTNQKTAREMGSDAAAAQAEAQATEVANKIQTGQKVLEGAQDLHQSDQEHLQGIQQQAQQHQADMVKQHAETQHKIRHDHAMHEHEQRKARDKHEQEMRHAEEKHAQALKHAAALAKAKPKTPSK